jgi:hypothetical protein
LDTPKLEATCLSGPDYNHTITTNCKLSFYSPGFCSTCSYPLGCNDKKDQCYHSRAPTTTPTNIPTYSPSSSPTYNPTNSPIPPTNNPIPTPTTNNPTPIPPTNNPTPNSPTNAPTNAPIFSPSQPTHSPTPLPTKGPTTVSPTSINCPPNNTWKSETCDLTILSWLMIVLGILVICLLIVIIFICVFRKYFIFSNSNNNYAYDIDDQSLLKSFDSLDYEGILSEVILREGILRFLI